MTETPTVRGWQSAPAAASGRGLDADNLLADERARFNLEDAIQEIVGPHVDRCTRCADPACRTEGRHDAGHRCRKVA